MNYKKIAKLILLISGVFLLQPVSAGEFTMGKVIAYPNPFSPVSDTLTIVPEGSSSFSGDVQFTVYNFNEKIVYSGATSNSAIYWSGHTADGKALIPGLYFIKIVQTKSDFTTGYTTIKLIVK